MSFPVAGWYPTTPQPDASVPVSPRIAGLELGERVAVHADGLRMKSGDHAGQRVAPTRRVRQFRADDGPRAAPRGAGSSRCQVSATAFRFFPGWVLAARGSWEVVDGRARCRSRSATPAPGRSLAPGDHRFGPESWPLRAFSPTVSGCLARLEQAPELLDEEVRTGAGGEVAAASQLGAVRRGDPCGEREVLTLPAEREPRRAEPQQLGRSAAGGQHGPVPRSAAISGYSIESPTGERADRPCPGRCERGRPRASASAACLAR